MIQILKGNYVNAVEIWKKTDDPYHPEFKGSYGPEGFLGARLKESLVNNELPHEIVGIITLSTM
jgi:hypothetical protein